MFGKFALVLVLTALAVGLAARSSHGAGPERTYVVKPTDTLWSIAAHSYGGDNLTSRRPSELRDMPSCRPPLVCVLAV